MERAYKLINRSEQLYISRKSVKRGLNFLFRCYEAYFFGRDFKALNRGYANAKKIFEENRQSVTLALVYALFAAVKGNMEEAEAILRALEPQLKFIRANDMESYVFYHYVLALKEIFKDNISGCLCCAEIIEGCSTLFSEVFLADIYIFMLADYNKIGGYLKAAYNKGNRSRIFFGILHKFYSYKKENDKIGGYDELLIPFFRWGCAREADISDIVEANADKISLKGFESLRLCFKLYKIYSGRNIITQIIKVLMNNFDYSEQAYYIYKDAVYKQIETPGLIDFFVSASYRLGIEKMGIYPLKKYLTMETARQEVKGFVYHIILNDGKYAELLENNEKEIIKYGINAFANGVKGRYYYSIYKYVTDKAEEYRLPSEIYDGMLKLLADIAFCYEVETNNEKTAFVRIKQRDTNKMLSYPVNNLRAYVYATSDGFTVYSFDGENREILTGDVKKNRLIKNADAAFFMRLYENGLADDRCLIFLGRYFSSSENLKTENAEILSKACRVKGISRGLKMRIVFRLGRLYYNNGEKVRALTLFNELDLNFLNEKNIEALVKIYTASDEIDSAVSVITKKSYAVSDKTMFYTIRKAARDKSLNASVSCFAYELLMKKHYDAAFVETVDKFYSGSLDEWIELGRVLEEMTVSDRRVDERILKQSILAHRLDEVIERVFSNVYYNAPESAIIQPFIAFICCLIITEGKEAGITTTEILEKEFLKDNSDFIGAALSYIYINHNVTTDRFYDIMEKIKKNFEEKKISLPCFANKRDKIFHSPFIDKNTAFCYRGSKDREVFLFYRRGGKGRFIKRKMNYFKFGLYLLCLNVFYGEKIEYYFSEQLENGSIQTASFIFIGSSEGISPDEDMFFEINEAFCNRSRAKYNLVEKYLSSRDKKEELIISRLL